MKHLILTFICFLFVFTDSMGQNSFNIISTGQGRGGSYFVKVTTVVKKIKDAQDILKHDAVEGVLFYGFTSSDGSINQKPLVSDPNVEQTKAEFFKAFFNEKQYLKYVTMTESSFSSIKVKKGYEVSALFLVDKESLQHYLEDSGIIKGFSNLW